MLTPYEILGVDRNASQNEIKRAYRDAVLKVHPDRNPENPELANKTFQVVREAYNVLIDPEARALFDQTLPQMEPEPEPEPVYKPESAKSKPSQQTQPKPRIVVILLGIGLVFGSICLLVAVVGILGKLAGVY